MTSGSKVRVRIWAVVEVGERARRRMDALGEMLGTLKVCAFAPFRFYVFSPTNIAARCRERIYPPSPRPPQQIADPSSITPHVVTRRRHIEKRRRPWPGLEQHNGASSQVDPEMAFCMWILPTRSPLSKDSLFEVENAYGPQRESI